jgi:hypothetical protein
MNILITLVVTVVKGEKMGMLSPVVYRSMISQRLLNQTRKRLEILQ